MKRSMKLLGFILLTVFVFDVTSSFAQMINYERARKRKLMKEGKAYSAPAAAVNKAPQSVPAATVIDPAVTTKVATPAAVAPSATTVSADTKMMLKEVVDQVRYKGNVKVSALTAKYDKNKDGLISKEEVTAIVNDTK